MNPKVPSWVFLLAAAGLAVWVLLFGGIQPGPGPEPTPTPAVSALVIENQEDRTAEQGIVLGSQRVRAAFPGGFRIEDPNVKNPPPELKAEIERAVPRGLPYLYLFDDGGKVTWEGSLPATIDELLKLKEGRRP